MQLISYFFWLSTNINVRITPRYSELIVHLAFTKRSHIVHRSFTVHFTLRLRSAFAHRSPFISVHQIPFSVCSQFAQSVFTVRSECTHRTLRVCSRTLKVRSPFKRGSRMFRDCRSATFDTHKKHKNHNSCTSQSTFKKKIKFVVQLSV